MKNKKLLAVSGSPHQNGTTATMLEYVMHEAEKKGWTINRVNLYEKTLLCAKGVKYVSEQVFAFKMMIL